MVISPLLRDLFWLDQRSVIACNDAIVAIIADVGFHVPTPQGIEALVNSFLYFIFDLRRLLYRRRFFASLPVRECRKNQNGNREVEWMLHGSSPEIKSRHSTASNALLPYAISASASGAIEI